MLKNYNAVNDTFGRVKTLSDYNLDYTAMQNDLHELVYMAQIATGTSMAFVNILDADNQWTVAATGFGTGCIDKNESVCQYTVAQNCELEINDLLLDNRVSDLEIIRQLGLRYYYGSPIRAYNGQCLGSLCVADTSTRSLTEIQKSLLVLLSHEVLKRFEHFRQTQTLQSHIQRLTHQRRMLAHDIRGPIGGIVGLAALVCDEQDTLSPQEMLEYMRLIKESGNSVLDMASDILSEPVAQIVAAEQTTLLHLKKNITQLFMPRIIGKNIRFAVNFPTQMANIPFVKGREQQIIGNLLSNAIKFTPEGGQINIDLHLARKEAGAELAIAVSDNGVGMDEQTVTAIRQQSAATTIGTNGEAGYGLGLQLVQQLTAEAGGKFTVSSKPYQGSKFRVCLPVTFS